jgi:hypothetical protein
MSLKDAGCMVLSPLSTGEKWYENQTYKLQN